MQKLDVLRTSAFLLLLFFYNSSAFYEGALLPKKHWGHYKSAIASVFVEDLIIVESKSVISEMFVEHQINGSLNFAKLTQVNNYIILINSNNF